MDANQIAVISQTPLLDREQGDGCRTLFDRPGKVPAHVAMILDGNRRWARMCGQEPVAGCREGAARLFDTVQWCEQAGVGTLTLWVLSVCNLARPAEELDGLLPLIVEVVDGLAARRRWRIRHLGEADLLSSELQASLRRAATNTERIEGMRSTWPSAMTVAARSSRRSENSPTGHIGVINRSRRSKMR